MQKSSYRPLKPRIGQIREPFEPQQKRERVRTACESCRLKRTKCDIGRPTCSACVGRGSVCVYVTLDAMESRTTALKRQNGRLKERNAAFQDLFDNLCRLPDNHAQSLLEACRTVPNLDPIEVLREMNTNSLSRYPSARQTTLGLLPALQSTDELEFVFAHPIVYPAFTFSAETINLKRAASTAITWSDDVLPCIEEDGHFQYSRSLLANLDISFWTAVPISNAYAQGAMSLYFELDHLSLGAFDAELFIQDLLNMKFDYCSPFLVSCLLAFASVWYPLQGYSSQNTAATALSLKFEEEAESLLEADQSDSLTNLSGLILLGYSYGFHAQVTDASSSYANMADRMGKRMRLFGVPDVIQSHKIRSLSADDQRAYSAAAWGVFNTSAFRSTYYTMPHTGFRPALPHPGKFELVKEGGTEEHASEFRSTPDPNMSVYCSVWTIQSEVYTTYRSAQSKHLANVSYAYSKYKSLLALADRLPSQMIRNTRSSPNALFFHIVYHVLILETFRPFLPPPGERARDDPSVGTPSPDTIFTASVQQLKGLMADFKTQHQAANTTMFWAGLGVMQVANAVTRDLTSPDWHSFFLYCIRIFQMLYPAFAVCKGIVQGLLAMAVQRSAITSAEARLILDEFCSGGDFHRAIVHTKGDFVVDFDLAVQDHQLAALEVLVEKFNMMEIFEDFTEGVL